VLIDVVKQFIIILLKSYQFRVSRTSALVKH
jgi:hypothetical protein